MISQNSLAAADTMLGQPDPKAESLYAADQMLGPEPSHLAGDAWDSFFRDPRKGLVNKAFNEAYDEAYGKQPLGVSPEFEKVMRDTGVWNDYSTNNYSLIKGLNEGVMRPAAVDMDAFMRTMYATARGAAATPWWSPAHPIGAVASAALEGAFPELMPHLAPVAAAKDVGILDRAPAPETVARERMAPRGPSATEIVLPGLDPREVIPSPSNIHEAARQLEPDLFTQYDALQDTKNNYLGMIDELSNQPREPSQRVRELEASLQGETSERRRERIQERLTAQVEADAAAAKERVDSLRVEMNTIDAQMREIAPDVSNAYKRARDMVPEPPPIEPAAVSEPETLAEPQTPEQREIYNLLQRRPTIAADVTRQLVDAGRPQDEARASAALIQAHYEARAARFGGALGSARDLYERDDPIIQAGEGRARGRLDLVRNQVTLMKDADASTFVHETAHGWLEELQRDAQHEKAPPDLIADLNAVRDWLGAEGAISRAQHEKFARGFERYLMEGVAPSNRLAQVFNKFRDWLTKIYQTVSRLRSPINDQIRGVYDRLLAVTPGDTIIAPEREVTNIAVQHEGDLATSTPETALQNADRMRAERDLVASTLKTEIESARRRYRNAGASTRPTAEGGPGGERVSETPTRAAGPGSEREEPPPTTTEVSPSGATFKAESTVGDDGRFGPTSDRFIDKAGNIRLDNLEAPDDVDAVIRATARYNNDFPGERRRDVTPGQLLELAKNLGQDARWLENKEIGQAFNYEEALAVNELLKQSANAIREVAVETAEGGDPLELAKAFARHEMIMGKASQARAEWGRAGHAYRALNQITRSTDFRALDQALRQQGRSYDELLQLARNIRELPDTGAISNVVRQSSFDKAQKGIVYIVTNGYLSGIFTHAGYGGGNLLRNIALVPGTAIEAGVGTARRLAGAPADDRVYWREVPATIYGLLHGTVTGWAPAYEAWKTGVQPPLPGQLRHGVALWAYDAPLPEAVKQTFGWPGKAVAAIHQYARVMFYTQELYRNIVRDAIDRDLGLTVREAIGQKGEIEAEYKEAQRTYNDAMTDLVENNPRGQALKAEIERLGQYPTNDLIDRAANEADKHVFQQRIPYKSMFAALQRQTEEHPLSKTIFPFITVGYNYMKQRVRLSPLAPLVGEYRSALSGAEGGAAFDAAAGKMIYGTTLFGGGLALGVMGIMTGPGPSEPKARAEWLLTHQPNSLKVGNVWIPTGGLGAHFSMLNFAAGLAQAHQFASKDDINSSAHNYWKVIMETATDESVFHDLAQLGKVVANPDREGPRWIANYVGGFVPFSAGLSQLNRHILDPNSKETRPGLEGIGDNILSRIPYASGGLYDRRDGFGEVMPTRFGALDYLWRDNYFASRMADPTVQWLNRIETGPARMDHTIEGVRLSPTQYDDLTRVSGRLGKKMLDEARPQIENAPRGMQVQEINRLLGQARHIGRQMLMMNYPQLMIDVTNEKYKKFQ